MAIELIEGKWQFKIPYGPGLWKALANYPLEFVNKVNTVVDFFEFRCLGDWFIYVETAIPPVGTAVLALLDFDWDDIVRGFLRPYGPRTRLRIGRGSGGRGHHILERFEIPEIGELIGKNLPGAKIIKSRPVAFAEKLFWTLDGLAQTGLFWWMILDITATFFYNWALGVFRSEECYESPVGYQRWACQDALGLMSDRFEELKCLPMGATLIKSYGEWLTESGFRIGHSNYDVQAVLMIRFHRAYGDWPQYIQIRTVDMTINWVLKVSPPFGPGMWAVMLQRIPKGRVVQFQVSPWPRESTHYARLVPVEWELRIVALP